MFHNSRSRARPAPRKAPVQSRSRDTVRTILVAAARVLEQRGLDGFNTNRVAERAGVSIGSVYQYFRDKDALLTALGVQNVEETERALLAELTRLRRRGASRQLFARGLIDVWCGTHAEPQHPLMYAIHSSLPELRARAEGALARFTQEVRLQLAAWGIREAELRAQVTVLTSLGLVHELVIKRPNGAQRQRAQREAATMLGGYLASLPVHPGRGPSAGHTRGHDQARRLPRHCAARPGARLLP